MFNEQLPRWVNPGTEPPTSKKDEGWIPNEKPPAGWLNWLFNKIYNALKELQEKAETSMGSQEKADAAEAAANEYTDQQVAIVADGVSAVATALASYEAEMTKYQNATGSNTITITTGGDFQYSQGRWIKWKQASTNTGAVTINVDGKGAKALRNFDGTALVSGDLEVNKPCEAYYSQADDFFILRPSGAKLDAIIAAIVSKGGSVATPQKVAEIVAAINDVAIWTNTGLKRYAYGSQAFSIPNVSGNTPVTVSGLNFRPQYMLVSAYSPNGARYVYLAILSDLTSQFYTGNGNLNQNMIGQSYGSNMTIAADNTNRINNDGATLQFPNANNGVFSGTLKYWAWGA